MASIKRVPMQVQVTTSPAELRKLADKMEAKIAKTALGESTVVESWDAEDVEIWFYFDQEAASMLAFEEVKINQLQVGDILAARGGMPFSIASTVSNCFYDEKNQCWFLYTKEQRQFPAEPYRFSREQVETLRFHVRRKR